MNLSSASLPNCNLNHTPFLNATAYAKAMALEKALARHSSPSENDGGSRYIGFMDGRRLVVADQEIRKLRIFASL